MRTFRRHQAGYSWLACGSISLTALVAASGILLGDLTALAQPTTVALTPSLPQGRVISLFTSSGIYTSIADVNFDEIWWSGQMTYGGLYTVSPLPNEVQFYQTLYFDGVGFESNVQDVSGCTNLHVDVFTPNGNSFAVRIVDTESHQADITFTTASGVITNNGWISLNLPLSQFIAAEPLLNLHYIQQLGWIINNAGETSPADYYIDNVYFNAGTNLVYAPPPAVPAPTNNAPTPTRPAAGALALYDSSGVYPEVPVDDWDASWSGSAESTFTIADTGATIMFLPGLSYVGVEFYQPDQIDTTGFSTLHFDVWTADANQIGVQLVSLDNGTQAPQINTSNIATNQWVGIDIPLSAFSAANPLLDLTDIEQLLWIDNASAGAGVQTGDFYIDNVYFWTTNQVQASIAVGAQISWLANSADSYQPQKSANGATWSNLGGVLSGTSPNSVYDPAPAPYYRVLQMVPSNVVPDPGFELATNNAIGAADWNIEVLPNAGATMMVTNQYAGLSAYGGTNFLLIQSITPATGTPAPPNTDVRSSLFPVAAGVTYNLSFYAANPVQIGGANPQYDVFYYNSANAPVGGPVFTSFASVGSTWTRVAATITPPAGATQMTIGWIQAAGAGLGEDWVTLIDNVSVSSGTSTSATNGLSATVRPGVGITWSSGPGLTYTVQSSPGLAPPVWSPMGASVIGTGLNSVPDLRTNPAGFYRVLEDY